MKPGKLIAFPIRAMAILVMCKAAYDVFNHLPIWLMNVALMWLGASALYTSGSILDAWLDDNTTLKKPH